MSDDNTPATDDKKDEATAATPAEEKAEASSSAKATEDKPVVEKSASAKAMADKKEEKKEESTVELSKDAQKILDAVKELKVLDLANLVKALEEEFGVSAAAPVAVAAPQGGAGGGDASGDDEKSSFGIELTAAGSNKIAAIKAVKTVTGEGLGEAKATVEAAPKVIKENVPKEEAEQIKKDLEAAGCTVALK